MTSYFWDDVHYYYYHYITWPWTTKPVISSTGIFVAIANNTLYYELFKGHGGGKNLGWEEFFFFKTFVFSCKTSWVRTVYFTACSGLYFFIWVQVQNKTLWTAPLWTYQVVWTTSSCEVNRKRLSEAGASCTHFERARGGWEGGGMGVMLVMWHSAATIALHNW